MSTDPKLYVINENVPIKKKEEAGGKKLKNPDVDNSKKQTTAPSTSSNNNKPPEMTRQNSLQRIQMRKQSVYLLLNKFYCILYLLLIDWKVYKLPKNQKMAKLAMYSACQYAECRCINWKTPEENRHRNVESNFCPKLTDECRNPGCKHPLGKWALWWLNWMIWL